MVCKVIADDCSQCLILDKLVLTIFFHIVGNYKNLIQLVMMTNKKEYDFKSLDFGMRSLKESIEVE